jgi:N-methylhydantoinase B
VLQLRADRHEHPPYGLFGGQPGASSVNSIDRGAGFEALPAKVTLEISGGDVVRHEQAGGGGWGDPALRDPSAIAADLADGKISPERARSDYGAQA